MDLSRLVRPRDHIREDVGGSFWGGFAPLHRGALEGSQSIFIKGGGGTQYSMYGYYGS